jgi:hypothetical protein
MKYLIRGIPMSISDVLLWPGTKICERMGVDPSADAGLIRSMFNMIVYLSVLLAIVWIVVA